MAGINDIQQIGDKKGKDFLNSLLNSFVIINQNIDGTFFGLRKNESGLSFFKKSGEITYVDRMLMKFYNPAIAHFNTISDEKFKRIPDDLYFGFEYIPRSHHKSANIKKNIKNNLVLIYIHKMNGDIVDETLQSKSELTKWAEFLEVEPPPIIFEGKLDSSQRAEITEFAYSSHDSLIDKFKTTSFSKYILSILNSKESDLTDDIDSIIFRFYKEDESDVYLAKIIDPIFKLNSKKINKTENKSNDYIWLIVIDLMNVIELYDDKALRDICKDESDYDLKYMKLVDTIFKNFVKKYSYKYEGLELDTPEYLKRPEFEIEYDLVNDEKVLQLIKADDTYKEIYRILINFFRKTRRKTTSGFFSSSMLNKLNIQVRKIKRVIMDDVLYEGLFPSFGEYSGDNVDISDIVKPSNKSSNKAMKVNILMGAYQPINKGHIKAARAMHKKNGLKTVFIAIYQKQANNILDLKYIKNLMNKVALSNEDIVEDVFALNVSAIDEVFKEIRLKYDPILWGSNQSRTNDYVIQLDYIKNRNIQLKISDEFKLMEIPDYISGDKIRDAISNEDYATFKEIAPNAILSEFFNLVKKFENHSNNK